MNILQARSTRRPAELIWGETISGRKTGDRASPRCAICRIYQDKVFFTTTDAPPHSPLRREDRARVVWETQVAGFATKGKTTRKNPPDRSFINGKVPAGASSGCDRYGSEACYIRARTTRTREKQLWKVPHGRAAEMIRAPTRGGKTRRQFYASGAETWITGQLRIRS